MIPRLSWGDGALRGGYRDVGRWRRRDLASAGGASELAVVVHVADVEEVRAEAELGPGLAPEGDIGALRERRDGAALEETSPVLAGCDGVCRWSKMSRKGSALSVDLGYP